MNDRSSREILVHLASGIGNIVLATPLLRILDRSCFTTDVLLSSDYAGVDELLKGWSAVRYVYSEQRALARSSYATILAAIPPFYWRRFSKLYPRGRDAPYRPADHLFFADEQNYYNDFARSLGCDVSDPPHYFLPIVAERNDAACSTTVVLAPGSKTGTMASKRWPYYAELSEMFDDVAIVGTADDLVTYNGGQLKFPGHVRSFIGRLSLKETATALASARIVVSNDCGLGHVAGAVGVPTILLFGPTPHTTLGHFPSNVTVMRRGLGCEPCWLGSRYKACDGRMDCLNQVSVDEVFATVIRTNTLI